ncbi:MAG: beta-ketoacyl-[acyl-carrier-protein] synthase family protein [Elusimicrobiota bacterium]|jgi:3-oxoacyl-[acyl-carrier-protein] synthase II
MDVPRRVAPSGDDPPRRVVVTGIGIVSPLGSGKERFWEALAAGRCAFARVRGFDPTGWRTEVGCEVEPPGPHSALSFVLTAGKEALSDAGLALESLDRSRCGVALGTALGEASEAEALMLRRLAGDETAWGQGLLSLSPAAIAARAAGHWGLSGPNAVLATACSAGNCAVAWAADLIAEGSADLMLAGGTEVFGRRIFAGFNRLLAAAPEFCAPYSKGRKGLVPAEGCAVLVLEEAGAAAARGAKAVAEVLGYGVSSDAFHATMPDSSGIAAAFRDCLADAGLAPAEVGYINGHGTGTPANDKAETAAVKAVFGPAASCPPMSSSKSVFGHAMGAASALEAAATCLTLAAGVLPPTMNFTPGDPDCDLDYVPEPGRRTDPDVALSNSSGFGGVNCVVAFARPGQARQARRRGGRRVVVTGLGLVGSDEEPMALVERVLPEADMRFVDAPIAAALAAAKRAFDDAGLSSEVLKAAGGVILDSSGELETQYRFFKPLEEDGPAAVEPFLFPTMLANAAVSRVAVQFGLRLVAKSFAGCFACGEGAVADACRFLADRSAGAVLAGRVAGDGPLSGAGVLVLEDLETARSRGGRILAELVAQSERFEALSEPEAGLDPRALALALQSHDFSKGPLSFEGRGPFGSRSVLVFAACH